ncbi:MAG TPA: hypothetical protein VNM48_08870 [Chloroflexota bacterium]|nr:hypothetical protein [Chloroflexota bacterium]
MAAKSKLTPEAQTRICEAITMGAIYEHAAAYGGITYETFRVWREKNPAFSLAVKDAEGRAVVGWLAKIEQAATDGAWQAAAWKLERRYPQDYGRTVQEHQGKDGGPIQTELAGTLEVRAIDYRVTAAALQPPEDE